jgi:hypothetical protein
MEGVNKLLVLNYVPYYHRSILAAVVYLWMVVATLSLPNLDDPDPCRSTKYYFFFEITN